MYLFMCIYIFVLLTQIEILNVVSSWLSSSIGRVSDAVCQILSFRYNPS